MNGLNLSIIKSLKIKLAPLSEQIKFAEALKKVNKIIERLADPQLNGHNLLASLSQKAFRGEL